MSQDFLSICAPSQLGCYEYIDCTLSIGRWVGEGRTGHPPSYSEAKRNETPKLLAHGAPWPTLGTAVLQSTIDCFLASKDDTAIWEL